jgi:predicted site-specific integrase-resolvase
MSVRSTGGKIGSRRLTARLVAEKYNVCTETVGRWVKTGVISEPIWINGNRYWDESDLEQRDRERAPMTRSRLANLQSKSANTEDAA